MIDFIVSGSGPSGVQAAQTLIDSGASVLMIDAGVTDSHYKNLIPPRDFISLRKEDQHQHRYFLGDSFEGIPLSGIGAGSQLTPPRKFITHHTEKWLPVVSNSFFPMESLAKGGLGAGWGTGCHVFSEKDLREIGLNPSEINEAYEVIAKRIGISGEKDDANPYGLGNISTFQKAVHSEEGSVRILKKYESNKRSLNQAGFYAGKLALAVLTEDLGERKKLSYDDMNFYDDRGQSAYRPAFTIDALSKNNRFTYQSGFMVQRFSENDGSVSVIAKHLQSGETKTFEARKLILACGTLGTARVVMRSSGKSNINLPIISNPYCYMPCIQWSMLGKADLGPKSGFGQIGLFYDPNGTNFESGMGALFRYRSLMLFRLIKEAPLNFSDARILMQYLQSSFVIAGIHHPERSGPDKFITLTSSDLSPMGDQLQASYRMNEKELSEITRRELKYKWALRTLGCYPIKTIRPGHGASIHYAGTLPYSDDHENIFSISRNGKLNGTKNIFVADGSGFRYLPAKGLTLTLMANAHCVATHAIKNKE